MSNPQKSVLVTGAAGFIAFHLIERLLRDGYSVLGVDNFDPFYPRAVKEKNLRDLEAIAKQTTSNFQFFEKDICDLDASGFSDVNISVVIHLAAKAGVRPSLENPESYLRANVQGTLRVLDFCRKRKIENLVFGSSSSVYGNDTPVPFGEKATAVKPISPYAASKRACELYCETFAHLYGLKIAMLRFFTVYGPRQRPDLAIHKFARLIVAGEPIPVFGMGQTSRDYTFVTDIIDGVLASMLWAQESKPGACEAFNLGGSSPISLLGLIGLLEKSLKKPVKMENFPPQPGDVEKTYADVSKSAAVLGYAPQVPIAQGIQYFADWILSTQVPDLPAPLPSVEAQPGKRT